MRPLDFVNSCIGEYLMLGTFGGWLGKSANKKSADQIGVSIMDAHNAHIKCKVSFQSYLDSTLPAHLDERVICRDDRCELGKWIHGSEFNHLKMHGEFYTLRSIHAQLHVVAGNVVEKIKQKDRAAAIELFDNQYSSVSRKVMQAVTELYKQAGLKPGNRD